MSADTYHLTYSPLFVRFPRGIAAQSTAGTPMHFALLLDEILRLIFEDCDRKYLVSAALTCKAWKDPALDVVWQKLDSSKPWLDFLENPAKFPSFPAYACRVKHISLQHEKNVCDERLEGATIVFPKLRTLRLQLAKSASALSFLHRSYDLETIDVSLGFKSRPPQTDVLLVKWFQSIAQNAGQLRHIRLRGSIPEGVNTSLCQMTTLQMVSLRLSHSMSVDVLAALSALPSLFELELHVGHLTSGAARNLLDKQPNLFPVLKKLQIRGKAAFLENFLSCLSSMTLHHLHVELDDEMAYADSWEPVLQIIATKTSGSLKYLSLEHHYNIEDIQQANSTTNPSHSISQVFSLNLPTIAYGDISCLRSLKDLNHFSCNLALPARLSDSEFDQILSWWPHLRYLDLGSLPNTESIPSYPVTLSAHALSISAGKCQQLEYLSLPCLLDDSSFDQNYPSNPLANRLRHLLVSTIKSTNSLRMAEYLHQLFPCLQTLECTDDKTDTLDDIISHLIPASIDVSKTSLLC
ncbi:hypothetical protein BJ165DRAFT_1531555 [Panaeolus papilionaceus]|nr:hypothetical protein BJ165DRAFT_1531555 [Panaeolus papilionaceus]